MTVYNGAVPIQTVGDFRAIVQGVEQAEARGDHVTAERLLRQALTLQEASTGPNHPEVANILNNLAIVCELNGKLTDAEACYRRAYAIATSSLPPGDPFVTTSRENLEQFCTARGIPFKQAGPSLVSVPAQTAFAPEPIPITASAPPPKPAAAPPKLAVAPPPKLAAAPPPKTAAPAPKSAAPVPISPAPPQKSPAPPTKAAAPPPARAAAAPPSHTAAAPPSLADFPLRASAPEPAFPRTSTAVAATRESSRVPAFAAMLALLIVLLAGGWYLFNSNLSPERTASAPSTASTATPTPVEPLTPPAEPPPPPAPVASNSAPLVAPMSATVPAAPPPAPAATAASAPEPRAVTTRTSSVDVVSAELCRSLTTGSVWNCAPATGTLTPGPIVFFTRVASPRDTTIEHRWYRDDRLHQRVPLRIRANPSGFRTYSRTAITPAGKWKVELRSQDGELLDEKTFAVQP
jgi:hypothetical protein